MVTINWDIPGIYLRYTLVCWGVYQLGLIWVVIGKLGQSLGQARGARAELRLV